MLKHYSMQTSAALRAVLQHQRQQALGQHETQLECSGELGAQTAMSGASQCQSAAELCREVELAISSEWDLIAWGIQSLTWHQQALGFSAGQYSQSALAPFVNLM